MKHEYESYNEVVSRLEINGYKKFGSDLVPQRLTVPCSETQTYPKLCPPHSHRLR